MRVKCEICIPLFVRISRGNWWTRGAKRDPDMPNQRPRRKREHAREVKTRECARNARDHALVHSLSIPRVCRQRNTNASSAIVDLVNVLFSHWGEPRHRGERAEKPNGAADSFYRARYRRRFERWAKRDRPGEYRRFHKRNFIGRILRKTKIQRRFTSHLELQLF